MPERRREPLAVAPLRRGPGPGYAVNAKPGVGLTSARPWTFRVTGAAGRSWHAVVPGTGLEGRVPGPDEALRFALFPVFDDAEPDVRDGYAATAATVDLVFTDGTRLSQTGAADQYGVPLEPAAQYAARLLAVDQWSSRTVPLAAAADRTVERVEVRGWLPPREGTRRGRRTTAGFVDRLDVIAVGPASDQPIEHVRSTRGTFSSDRFSRGNCAPLVALPHGFVFGLPMTDGGNRGWPYSYHEASRVDGDRVRPYLQAFSTSHLPSPWMGDRGQFHVFPHPDPLVDPDRDARALPFSHDDEVDRPHLYETTLGDEAPIRVRLGAGSRSVWLRAVFSGDTGALIFDQFDGDGRLDLPEPSAGSPSAAGRYTATGYVDGPGSGIRVPRTYVHVEVDGVVTGVRRFPGHPRAEVLGALCLDPSGDRSVTVAIGVSHLSAAQARRNLAADRSVGGFADIVDRARGVWSGTLGRLAVTGASADQLATLYSCLYRVSLYPNDATENVADGRVADWRYASVFDSGIEGPDTPERTGRRVVPGRLTVTDGFWDSYRASWPLRTLLDPKSTGRLLAGFVEHYRDGGWVSRWSAPGPADIMTGTSSDAVFADAAIAGLWDHDEALLLDAYDSCLRNATTRSPSRFVGRKGMATSMFTGYAATDTHEGMSWTVDAAINDAAIAAFSRHLAQRLPGHPRAAEFAVNTDWFTARAARYALMFHPETGFFRGREPSGRWRRGRFEPRSWGVDYTETNAYGTRFTAPHDGEGLARLYGGRAALEAALDEFLALPETARAEFKGGYPVVIHEQREARDTRMGMLALSNQPAHHIPFMYAYASRPGSRAHAKTQTVVRDAVQRLFTGSDLGQGYPGDEDNGELSAWYLLAVSGLYPLSIGSGEFVLCAPLFPRLTWTLEGGATIDVIAPAAAPENRFVQSLTIDGEPWESITVDRARLAAGATLVFELGPEPADWAAGSVPASLTPVGAAPSPPTDLTSPGEAAARATGGPQARRAFDDSSATPPAHVEAGGQLGWRFDEPVTADHYTVTFTEPGAYSWMLQARNSGGAWTALDTQDAAFSWPNQTRAFAVGSPRARTEYRLVFTGPAAVAQLEFLTLR